MTSLYIGTSRAMRAPERAADELKRAMTKLGLRGAMIASNIMGRNVVVQFKRLSPPEGLIFRRKLPHTAGTKRQILTTRRPEFRAAVGDGRRTRRLHVHASIHRRRPTE